MDAAEFEAVFAQQVFSAKHVAVELRHRGILVYGNETGVTYHTVVDEDMLPCIVMPAHLHVYAAYVRHGAFWLRRDDLRPIAASHQK